MNIQQFEDLEIWQEARDLCKHIFTLTSKEPFSRDFKLRDQIHGSSGSIMDNINQDFLGDRNVNKELFKVYHFGKPACNQAS